MNRAIVAIAITAVLAMSVTVVARNSVPNQTNQATGHDAKTKKEQTHTAEQNTPTLQKQKETSIEFQCPTTEERNESIRSETSETDWWSRISGIVTAFGTLALAAIGAVASVVAVVTLIYIGRQTHATKIAADAALRSAQAVINSERPWLVVHADTNADTVGMGAYNKGRTPAKVVGGYSEWTFVGLPDKLPLPPAYSKTFFMPELTFIVSNDSFPILPRANPEAMIDQHGKRAAVDARTEFLVFYGKVIYDDFLAGISNHETRWCFCYDPTYKKMIGGVGPKEYSGYS